ncbi:MAG TPA: cytochrome C oxidase subunit IV family protein [Actinomycetota bacterium]
MTERTDVDTHERAHPGPREYVKIAVILAVITAIEVAIFYIEFIKDSAAFVPTLLLLSAIKFGMVVLWFMHLRFDSRLFGRLFVAGLALALSLFIVVLLTFGVFFK